MKVLITGTSQGIGKAIAERFLQSGHTVIGIDRQAEGIEHELYTHYECDVRDKERLPRIDDVEILINNAGTQNQEDIDINLKALIYVTEKYGVHPGIKSVLNIGYYKSHRRGLSAWLRSWYTQARLPCWRNIRETQRPCVRLQSQYSKPT